MSLDEHFLGILGTFRLVVSHSISGTLMPIFEGFALFLITGITIFLLKFSRLSVYLDALRAFFYISGLK